jgi:hypothetical protein
MKDNKNVIHRFAAPTILPLVFLALSLAGLASAAGPREESGIYGNVHVQARNSNSQDVVSEAEITALDSNGNVIARTLSNSKGEFRLLVPAGTYRLKAEHSDYLGFDTQEAILQVQDGHFTLFNIGLPPAESPVRGEIRGTVTGQDGGAVAEAQIIITDEVGSIVSSLSSDQQGVFSTALDPGMYTVTASHPEYTDATALTANVGAGQPIELTLILEIGEENLGVVQGIIRARADGGAPGRPVTGAVITARDDNGATAATATTNEIGFYKMSLPPGNYRLAVSHPEFEITSNNDEVISIEAESLKTWNALLQPLAGQTGVRVCRDRFPVTIGSSYGERHSIYIRIDTVGVLTVSYRWTGDAGSLSLIVTGPDGMPRRVDGRAPLSITTEVSTNLVARGTQWEITVANFGGGSGQGAISVSYPCEQ